MTFRMLNPVHLLRSRQSCLALQALSVFVALSACLLSIKPAHADLPDTVARVKGSVVGIGSYLPTRRPPGQFFGTGFVVGDGSYVVTNSHVANQELNTLKKERLVIIVGRGSQAKQIAAKVVAESSKHDLAVLKIATRLVPMKLSDQGMIREGSSIAFTGFPIGSVLGLYPVTSQGIISSITPIAIPSFSSQQLNATKINRLRDPIEVYQLDAIAYPGNSGSPVYDPESGEVIGIINMVHVKETKEDVLSKPSAISYAIPVKYLQEMLQTATSGE